MFCGFSPRSPLNLSKRLEKVALDEGIHEDGLKGILKISNQITISLSSVRLRELDDDVIADLPKEVRG